MDMMMFVNFYANHIIISQFLELKLLKLNNGGPQGSALPRIVLTSSDSHRWLPYKTPSRFSSAYPYSIVQAVQHYGYTKLLAQMLINFYTKELAGACFFYLNRSYFY